MVSLLNLPPVFQDAIKIIRTLGYKYVWIDALCILQDSADDWRSESSKMNQYYKGSSLNIIAAAARDPTYGIFDSADSSREHWRYYASSVPEKKNVNFVKNRAWAFQEEILSPRSIVYTSSFLYWLCNYHECGEPWPDYVYDNGYREPHKSLFDWPILGSENSRLEHPASKVSTMSSGEEIDRNRFEHWLLNIVNEYVTKSISFPRDRLPGIAGLAKEFGSRVKAHYICGICLDDFVNGLCWYGYGARINSSEYLGPTWSWTALAPHSLDSSSRAAYHIGENDHLLLDDLTAKFVSTHILYEAEDLFGQVKEATVLLEAPCLMSNALPHPLHNNSGFSMKSYLKTFDRISYILDTWSNHDLDMPSLPPEAMYLRLG
jgi:hypothetical protein